MVGTAGFEPTTTTPPVWCATRLRYAPRSRILATTPRFGYAYDLHHCFGVGRRPSGPVTNPIRFQAFRRSASTGQEIELCVIYWLRLKGDYWLRLIVDRQALWTDQPLFWQPAADVINLRVRLGKCVREKRDRWRDRCSEHTDLAIVLKCLSQRLRVRTNLPWFGANAISSLLGALLIH